MTTLLAVLSLVTALQANAALPIEDDDPARVRWCNALARDAGVSLEYLRENPAFQAHGQNEAYYVWLMEILRGWKGTKEQLERFIYNECYGVHT